MAADTNIEIALGEDTFNAVMRSMEAQRPSMFNFASPWFRSNPDKLCHPVPLPANGAPILTPIEPLGGSSGVGLEYCLQLREPRLDVHPHAIQPPPGLNVPSNSAILSVSLAAGFAAPNYTAGDVPCPPAARRPQQPLRTEPEFLGCFDISLFAVVAAGFRQCGGRQFLYFECADCELADILPGPLEDALEAYLKTFLNAETFPGMWAALAPIEIDVTDTYTIAIALSPSSHTPNPEMAGDAIRLRLHGAM